MALKTFKFGIGEGYQEISLPEEHILQVIEGNEVPKLDDVQAFLDELGVTSQTAPSSVTLSNYGIIKKADDIAELYIIPAKDADNQNVAGKYFLVNTSGTVVKSKSRNKDGNDYYFCVNNSGNIIAIYTEK